jgi:hypothetical protein
MAYSYLFDGTEGNIEHEVAVRRYVAMFTRKLEEEYPGATVEVIVGQARGFAHELEIRIEGPIAEGEEGWEIQQSVADEVHETAEATAMIVLEDWTDWLIDLGT